MTDQLTADSRRADALMAEGRALLVSAIRRASAEGRSQTDIAARVGRSQPEVSRLLRFHGTTPLARRVRRQARDIKDLVAAVGGSNVRVFGSLATGRDHEGSDVDLLFTMGTPLSLMELGALEADIGRVVSADVDLLPESAIRPGFRSRILDEAVPL